MKLQFALAVLLAALVLASVLLICEAGPNSKKPGQNKNNGKGKGKPVNPRAQGLKQYESCTCDDCCESVEEDLPAYTKCVNECAAYKNEVYDRQGGSSHDGGDDAGAQEEQPAPRRGRGSPRNQEPESDGSSTSETRGRTGRGGGGGRGRAGRGRGSN